MGANQRSLFTDLQSAVVGRRYAVIYAPGQRRRDRFPENTVQVVESEEAARATADPARKRFAALVQGPSRSSEGFKVYYLVSWLN